MEKEDWQKVKTIFDDALAVPAADRLAYLDRVVGTDNEIRPEVERLLTAYESGFLEDSAISVAAEALAASGLATGQIVGRYQIQELIGTGGMGEVFRADDTELDRSVAFKVLHRDVAEDEERVRRFIQEARAASALNHPNILTIHEIGTFEGSRYIVSEYIDGATLRDKMHEGLKTVESVEITCQIAAALQAAHSAGIVHRDIKPENVMIRRDGLVKVLDFGLAKLTEADDRPIDASAPLSRVHTSPGLVMGTVAYMSPEQAKGQPVDARTDLWSLGVVLHEMLTGSSPFGSESVTDLVSSIIKKDTQPANLETLPSELRPICQKALAKDKDSRYRSAHDLLKDLEGEKKRMEYAIQPTPYISSSGTDDLKTQRIRPRPTLSAEYIVTSVKRHKFASLAAALLLVVTAVGLSVYRYNGATPPMQANGPDDPSLITPSTREKDLQFSRLPISGQTSEIVISPDGKNVAYLDAPPRGIKVFQLDNPTEIEILPPPAKGGVWNLAFSPDSKFVYYLYGAPGQPDRIMRIPMQGGAPAAIADDPEDGVGFSSDGSTLAFARGIGEDGKDGMEIILADPDGTSQRSIAKTAPGTDIVNSPTFSPDGKRIACQISFPGTSARYTKLVAFKITGGEPEPLSPKQWANVYGAAWLPNGNIVISAIELDRPRITVFHPQLWVISPDGQAKQITAGLTGYQGLSSTRSGEMILTRQVRSGNDLWMIPDGDMSRARQITTSGELSGGFTATGDGRVIMGSTVTGNLDLWIMGADGRGRKKLTTEGNLNVQPVVSPDNKFIVFTSDRGDGKMRLYRMDLDGQNVKPLTDGTLDRFARFSRDGKWIYYLEAQNDVYVDIKKIPSTGGQGVTVITAPDGWQLTMFDINPMDERIAFGLLRKVNDGPVEHQIRIVPVTGNSSPRIIDLPAELSSNNLHWMPDGKSLATLGRGSAIDVWNIPLDKTKPHKITDFRTPTTNNFNWSHDRKSMLVGHGSSTMEAVMIKISPDHN